MDEMLRRYLDGAEVVYAARDDRATDTAFKRDTANAFYALMSWLGVEMIPNAADYRLMGRRALEALSSFKETNLFLRRIVPSIGFPSEVVYYRRAERVAGTSKYPLGKMVSFALDGITSFSIRSIRFVLCWVRSPSSSRSALRCSRCSACSLGMSLPDGRASWFRFGSLADLS